MNFFKLGKFGRCGKSRLYPSLALAVASLGAISFADLPDPVAHWRMDSLNSSGYVPDATGGSNHLQLSSGCTLTNDVRFGGALFFDGTSAAWAQALENTTFTGARSVSIWTRREANDGPMDPTVNKIPYLFNNVSGMMVNYGWNSTWYRFCPTGAYAYNVANVSREEWHHTVYVMQDTDTPGEWALFCYLDGVKSYASTNAITIGTLPQKIIVGNTSAGGTRPFYGMIADMRVFGGAISAEDAMTLYIEGRKAELIGYWKMESVGAADASGFRTVSPEGTAYANLKAGSDILFVADGMEGQSAFFTNLNNSSLSVTTPYPMSGFSFGAWMNFGTNLAALEGEANNNRIPHVYTIGSYGRMCIEGTYRNLDDNRAHVFDVRTFDNGNDQGFVCPYVTVQKGIWSHLGVTYEMRKDAATGLYGVQPRIYVDGELVTTGRWMTASSLMGLYPKGLTLVLGNQGTVGNRPFGGMMDDFCFYSGVLTDAQMKDMYRGLPSVSAGDDFTVATPFAKLAGAIGTSGTMGNRAAAVVTPRWSVVSTPVGGEAAAFDRSDDLRATVSLPVEGAYVFCLTVKDSIGRMATNCVTVTRTATGGNVVPVVSVGGTSEATAYLPAALTAVATDADGGPGTLRVSWRVASGPAAVRFEPAQGVSTKATFFGAGTYQIVAVATDGQSETVSVPWTVDVSASNEIDLDRGLIGYWPFDVGTVNRANGTTYTVDRSSVTWETGVDGYAIRVRGALYPYLDSNTTLLETEDPELETTPIERYRAFSCWLYHDTSDTNNSSHATIVDVPYTLGLWYNCEDDTRGFTMYQQTMKTWNASSAGNNQDIYGRPEVDPANRWTHVYALFDRRTNYLNSTSGLWIDGVKQTNRTAHGMGGGRVRDGVSYSTIEIGGHANTGQNGFNGHFKDGDGNWLSRTFPGKIDELRMYNRPLTDAEIKYLAANPAVDVSRPPAVSGEPDMLVPTVRRAKTVEVKVNSDSYPASATLTYAWCVLSGDASKLVFADPTARATTVTAMKSGVYVVQLAVSDGARTVYSAPIPLDVQQAGITISFK